jgi:hypothetical protein
MPSLRNYLKIAISLNQAVSEIFSFFFLGRSGNLSLILNKRPIALLLIWLGKWG